MNTVQMFLAAIRAAGLKPPEVIEAGKLYRFSTNAEQSDDAGWCKLFEDGNGGVFGDWRTGLSETWQVKRENGFTAAEYEAFKRRCDRERQQREAEQARSHEEAARQAREILASASRDPGSHPYAARKSVSLGPLVKRGAWPQRLGRCLTRSDLLL